MVIAGCTDTPGAGPNNQPDCPSGQEFDEDADECVDSNGGPDPDAGIEDVETNQEPGNNQEENPWGDNSGDGIPNQYDNCPDHYNPDQTDTSGDGVGDACDNCPDHANPDQEYSEDNPVDDRGIIMGDACAPGVTYADTVTDTTGDGVPDIMDNCPDDHNPALDVGCDCPPDDTYCTECICTCPDDMYPCDGCEQLDSSGDGVGDACDNCPNHYNPNQTQAPGNPTDDRGITMGDACAPEPNNIPICETQDTEFQEMKPNVYVAFDISGSMGWDAPSGNSRMEEALDGLDLVAEELADDIRFGLGTFPHPSAGSCDTAHILDVGEYTESELKSTWGSYTPTGATPMYAIVNDIRNNYRLDDPTDDFDDDRVKAVLLVTDGEANCSGGNSQQNVENALSDIYDQGVLTFVVGFNISDPSLEAYANAGGTGAATEYGGHFLANEGDELAEAMSDVADLLVSCSYTLDPAPEDENKIWIEVDNDYYLDTDSYHYDTGDNILTLSDAACDEVRDIEGDELQIEIKMGCASQCVPEEPEGLCDMWYETCGEDICDPCEPEVCDGTDNNCSGVVDDHCLECSLYQESCETTADCCEPFVCNDEGYCDRECYPLGAPCRSSDECCDQCAIQSGEEVGECISG